MKTFKNICKYSLIVLCFLLIYIYLGIVLLPKDLNDSGGVKYFNERSINYEASQSLDVLFMGNSNIYSDIMPLEIYNQTGIRSFDCAYGHQSIKAVRMQLERLLKKQSPKIVVLDTDCFFEKNTFFTGSNTPIYTNLISPFKYHARWKELEFKDFYSFPKVKADPFKGYLYSTDITSVAPKHTFDKPIDVCEKIEGSVVNDVKKIYKICQKNNIHLFFIHLPTISWSAEKSNAVQKLANSLNVVNIDMNLKCEQIGIDFSKHYVAAAGTHMNFEGATHITNYMIDLLKEKNETEELNIQDMRGYDANWDLILSQYQQKGESFYLG